MVMLNNGADHTTIAIHDQPARKPLSRSVNRVTCEFFSQREASLAISIHTLFGLGGRCRHFGGAHSLQFPEQVEQPRRQRLGGVALGEAAFGVRLLHFSGSISIHAA
jgi:hypothetical protein